MARPLNREKRKTRTLILQTATKLFLENGYEETRIRDIATESGVGYNEIFRMYGDKDNLLFLNKDNPQPELQHLNPKSVTSIIFPHLGHLHN